MKSLILKLLIATGLLFSAFTSFASEKPKETVFPAVEIIGSAVPPYNWLVGADMATTDGINYILIGYTLAGGEAKFRQDQSWLPFNWGASSFPEGIAFQYGPNIPITAGTYTITFNRLSGEYNFYYLGQGRKKFVNDASLTDGIFTTAAGNDANAGTLQSPYRTIQKAIQQSVSGDTIYVDAGAYPEQVIIDKAITIIGAGQSSVISVPAAPLVNVPGINPKGLVQSTLINGNIHLKNLNVISSVANGYYGIILQSGGSVKGCKISNAYAGIFVNYNSGQQMVGIYNNIINDVVAAISCQGTQLTIGAHNNEITLRDGPASVGFFVGIDYGPTKAFTAFNNIVSNYKTYGFIVNSRNTIINSNRITGVGGYAISQEKGLPAIATCNWFGTSNADSIKTKISGLVDYSPWLVTCADTSAAPGFQSVYDSCKGIRSNDYVFSGNGNWSDSANWTQRIKPPSSLP